MLFRSGDARLVCAVPRLVGARCRAENRWPLGDFWGDEKIRIVHRGKYENLFTGTTLEVGASIPYAELFASFPVAVLLRRS